MLFIVIGTKASEIQEWVRQTQVNINSWCSDEFYSQAIQN